MMWMMGTNGGLFSILLMVFALSSSLEQVMSLNKAFASFEGIEGLWQQKLVYFVLSMCVFGWVGKKGGEMGLLPIATGDWLDMLQKETTYIN